MRVSEVLSLKPADIDDQKLFLCDPKSGRELDVLFIPKKKSRRLQDYVRKKYSTQLTHFSNQLCRSQEDGCESRRNGGRKSASS
jgi:integrase